MFGRIRRFMPFVAALVVALGTAPASAGSSCQGYSDTAEATCSLTMAGASMGIDGTVFFDEDVSEATIRVTMTNTLGIELIRCEWSHNGLAVRMLACRDSFYVSDITHVHLPALGALTCRGTVTPPEAVSLFTVRCRSEGAN